ncbi:MAG TPA: FHA domain-containing protein [Ktedonobacteraceae bacterium]|nr:FHA domain-containing protein [Ktedonobacteraceae bacterium]
MAILIEGQRFERYRVIRWLGSGVAGESYEVENVMLQQKATLKLIHPWATLIESARRQFFREMQSMCLLHHPYLTDVVDYGEIDAQLYVARRYVSSGSLLGSEGRMWFRPPLPVNEAIQYGCQLARTLAYIHQMGHVHGALTLNNLLVLRGPNSKHAPGYAPFLLADVGLTHFVRRFGQPKTSLLPVTAAPEQLQGRVLPASDQFALAVIIYLWLAGRPPYLGSPQEIEQLKRTATFAPLTTLNSRVTVEQESVLARALSASPENRYPSVQSFANALQAALPYPSTPVTQKPTPALEPVPAPFPVAEIEPVPLIVEKHVPEEMVAGPVPVELEELLPLPGTESFSPAEPEWLVFLNALSSQQTGTDSELVAEPTLTPASDAAANSSASDEQNSLEPPDATPVEPLPRPEPDIAIPIPEPAPVPEPLPEVKPTPQPKIEPEEPAIEPLPRPEPDIIIPIPEPAPLPQPAPQPEPAPENTPTSTDESQQETIPSERIESEAEIQVARLVIFSPYTETSIEAVLEGDELTIGRAGSSDILLDYDDNTSRHHALLRREESRYVLYDRQSASGVFVNGQKLPEQVGHVLVDGDMVSIGNYTLTFLTGVPMHNGSH